MKNLARNGSWKRITKHEFYTEERQVRIANDEDLAYIGPGHGGICNGGAVHATPGDWPEGNPDVFWAVQWQRAPDKGEAQYVRRSQPGRFTWFEYKGIKSARTLAGKRVCASWWLRSPGGCTVIPVIWRGNLDLPVEERTPFEEISMQLWSGEPQVLADGVVTRVNFAKDLPAMPSGVKIGPSSYLGFGLDFPTLGTPCVHMGPYAFYEVKEGEEDEQEIEEVPYYEEVVNCMADYIIANPPSMRRRR